MDRGGPTFQQWQAQRGKGGTVQLTLIRHESGRGHKWHLLHAGCSCPSALDLAHGVQLYDSARMTLDTALTLARRAPVYRLADGRQGMVKDACKVCSGLLLASLREKVSSG